MRRLSDAIRAEAARLKAVWTRLGYQMPALPEFDDVFRSIERTLGQSSLP